MGPRAGPWILAAVAVVAAGYWGWHLLAEPCPSSAALELRRAISRWSEAFTRNDLDGGVKLADALIKDYPSSAYADQANLAAARVQVERRSLDLAAARLRAGDAATDGCLELALIARLRLARVQLAQGKPDDALKTLDGGRSRRFQRATRRCAAMCCWPRAIVKVPSRSIAPRAQAVVETLDVELLDLKIDELEHS